MRGERNSVYISSSAIAARTTWIFSRSSNCSRFLKTSLVRESFTFSLTSFEDKML